MKFFELFEELNPPKIAIFGGRFQPFHKGHYKVYELVVKKFGKECVYIATSNKTNFHNAMGDISPFNFKEKFKIINGLYGMSNIIETSNPLFYHTEIKKLHPNSILISVTGLKNANRFENNDKIEQYDESKHQIDTDKLYFLPIYMQEDGLSGTMIRKKLLSCKTESGYKDVFIKYFGKYDKDVCEMMVSNLKRVQ